MQLIENILKELPSFGTLLNSEIQNIIENSIIKEFKNSEIIFTPDDKCKTYNILLSGKLKAVNYSYSGKEKILNYIEKSQEFGSVWFYSNQNYPAYIICEEKTQVLMIDENILFDLFSNKVFLKTFFKDVSQRILNLSKSIELLSISNIKQRIVLYLLREYNLSKSNIINLKISKSKLASELGTVREVISRNISRLEKEGYIKILSENSFEVLDISEFEKIIE